MADACVCRRAKYMMPAMKRKRRLQIGILGGTFNPIHIGHLLIAQDALEQAALDCVKFIPTAAPPHKKLDGEVSSRQRLAMVRAAIRGNDRFEVDDIEIRRGGKSYSIETLTELKRQMPEADFHFIIGADSLAELATWREIDRLAKLCRFIVAERPGCDAPHPDPLPGGVRGMFITGHVCDVASRDIRARAAKGLSIRYLVPDGVFRYIQRHKIYL
jgi:nicotinate-nucleotide adenylyltransferase